MHTSNGGYQFAAEISDEQHAVCTVDDGDRTDGTVVWTAWLQMVVRLRMVVYKTGDSFLFFLQQ